MDEGQLKKILGEAPVPAVDENAQKTAVNLALAEFEAVQTEERNKIIQGSSLWGRLTGRPNNMERRKTMNKRFIYGGMATAMVVVLAAGVTMQSYMSGSLRQETSALMAAPGLKSGSASVDAPAGGMQTFSQIAKNEVAPQLSLPEGFRTQEADKRAKDESFALVEGKTAPMREKQMRQNMVASEEAARSDYRAGAAVAPSAPVAKMAAPTESMAMADSSVGYIVAPEPLPQQFHQDVGRDKFEDFEENQIKLVQQEPVSTFSVDVDTSSYAFIRKQLNAGVLPQKDAVRVEEMVNYFDYEYPLPENKTEPFKSSVTVLDSPWNAGRKLVHIGIKGYDIPRTESPRSNLVFLLDTSGSMNEADKLPLLVSSFKMLLESLKPDDTVAIVTYAGSAGTVLEPTKASDKAKIIAALDNLSAGGSTAGAEGIRQAYALAEAGFDKNAVNRVILATDGDFNVGITNPEELQDFVEHKRESGIFLSVLGFGQGNYNDQMMQTLAQNGNGVAAYIDTLNEARKVLVEEASSTLFPIAKDVKIQVEFNPATVAEYRLVGYETRKLNREDFNNDKVDAGDIGAGHTVTAIYEITPAGGPRAVDDSRYAAAPAAEMTKVTADIGNEYAFLKIRYKLPDEDTSKLITTPITAADEKLLADTKCSPKADCLISSDRGASDDVRFSVAVASFAQLLKGGKHTGSMTYDDVIAHAQAAKGGDEFGYRAEFINLARLAKSAAALPDTQP
ncbi:MAG: VWA domain-containing protein [Micavibrio aeruginosavorus]|uniref:VWA domain-containing protein n=1 Tax=Micavibrio aeruginosavorus TaxID=349221 RepID=A0A7T5UHU1_9BACT|nr:MAG: VWA domain-containing protein [Micavibrio aeruginosavorus]